MFGTSLTALDWWIVAGFVIGLVAMLFICNKYLKSVADFLSANRCAGRYMLTLSEGISGLGAITVIANFQEYYRAGFCPTWWQILNQPIALIMAVSGWVIYRYRETRCLTLAQFFETRYSRKFRIFAGFICFLSGVLNYGIFPQVSANFFMAFCNLPEKFHLIGIPFSTFPCLIAGFLALAVCFTFFGGQIAIMVTDFIQAMFFNLIFLAIVIIAFLTFKWSQCETALMSASADQSLLNPYNTTKVQDFNMWYYMILFVSMFYGRMSWQGSQGYNCSAKNPHEARMAGILGMWRSHTTALLLFFVPICAYTMMHHPDFSVQAAKVNETLAGLPKGQLADQARTPLAMLQFLPVGFLGLFVAAMFGAMLSTDDTYLHSWGSIFIQDVIMPFRKKPFTQKQHLRILKCSILGVAVFAFFFSWLFKQTDAIKMFFMITGAIFTAGAGSVIIGGLYWKRGTTAGAWAAMIVGSFMGVGGALVRQYMADQLPTWCSAAVLNLFAIVAAIAAYVSVSLLKPKVFNLDKMLHRGQYDDKHEHGAVGKTTFFQRLVGVSREFTLRDRLVYYFSLAWTFFWLAVFVIVTIYHYTSSEGTTDGFWSFFWKYKTYLGFALGVIVTVWFTIGGIGNVREMFATLKTERVDAADDGWVESSEDESEER